jgi:hypothetical protein
MALVDKTVHALQTVGAGLRHRLTKLKFGLRGRIELKFGHADPGLGHWTPERDGWRTQRTKTKRKTKSRGIGMGTREGRRNLTDWLAGPLGPTRNVIKIQK